MLLVLVIVASIIETCAVAIYAMYVFYNLSYAMDYGALTQSTCNTSARKLEKDTARCVIYDYINNNRIHYSKLLWLLLVCPGLAIWFATDANNAAKIVIVLVIAVYLSMGIVVINSMSTNMANLASADADYATHRSTTIKHIIEPRITETKTDFSAFVDKVKVRIAHVLNLESINDCPPMTSDLIFEYTSFANTSSQNITPDMLQVLNVLTQWYAITKDARTKNATLSIDDKGTLSLLSESTTTNGEKGSTTSPCSPFQSLSSDDKMYLVETIVSVIDSNSEPKYPISISQDQINATTSKLQNASDPLEKNTDVQYFMKLARDNDALNSSSSLENALVFLSNPSNGDPTQYIRSALWWKWAAMYAYSVMFVIIYMCMHWTRSTFTSGTSILASAILIMCVPIALYIMYWTSVNT